MDTIDVEITMPTEAYEKLCSMQDLYVFIKTPEEVDKKLQEISPGIRPANPKFNAILNGLVIDSMMNHELVPFAFDDDDYDDEEYDEEEFEEYMSPMEVYYKVKDAFNAKENEVIDITQYMKHK